MQPSTTQFKFHPEQELQLQAMRVDALACINAAQRRVADVLFQVGASERMVRMALSDLLETLLARAGACIATSEGFPQAAHRNARCAYLTLHLEQSLAAWLRSNARDAREEAAATRCLSALQYRTA